MLRTNKVQRILILGNGFDVDLGMKSRYSDFAKSKIWKEKIEGNAEAKVRDGLLKALINAKEHDNWFDIEQTMMNYVLKLQAQSEGTNYGYESYETDEEEYHIICDALRTYLRYESDSFSPKNSSVAENVIREMLLAGMFHKIYTFNYTDLKSILEKKLCITGVNIDVNHMHGSLIPPDDIILGVEGEAIIPEEYKFLYKTSSRYYRYNNLYTDLQDASEVVFFGHSINGMDFWNFQEFFKQQSRGMSSLSKRKWIRIFTYDEKSMQAIKFSLRENEIDPKALYRLNNFDFIQTKDLENGDKWEEQKYEQFKKDLVRLKNLIPGGQVSF